MPSKPNRLAVETRHYLIQHAHNPVCRGFACRRPVTDPGALAA